MTDRTIQYPGVGVQDTDFMRLGSYYRSAIGQLAGALFGTVGTTGVACGFGVVGYNALSLLLGSGVLVGPTIPADATAYGGAAIDPTPLIPVAFNIGNTAVGPVTAAGDAGQVSLHVIYATFTTADTGMQVLYYQNADNPAQVFRGVGNDGQGQPTARVEAVGIAAAIGAPAAPGSAAQPPLPPGAVPLYLLTVPGGTAALDASMVAQHPASPFYAGIGLVGTGDPNGRQAGNSGKGGVPPTSYYDTAANTVYYCTQSGNAAAAVWMRPSVAATAETPTPARGLQYVAVSGPFVVPPYVRALQIEGWGGGGPGGHANGGGGGGGSGGGHSVQIIPVTPGETLTITIGGGGVPASGGNTTDATGGGLTSISRGATVLWEWSGGGGGGTGPNGPGSLAFGSDNGARGTGFGESGQNGASGGGLYIGGKGGSSYGYDGGTAQIVVAPGNTAGNSAQIGGGGSGGCGTSPGGNGGSGFVLLTWGY